ncbi:MAG: hypothetical protein U1E05_11155 [Patescibacteria group bacterium]|nr:hypothetical protein [Patescibacteria group bacterium]
MTDFRPDADVSSALEIVGLAGSLALIPLRDDANYQGPYVAADTNADFIPHLFGSALSLRTQSGLEYLYDIATGKLLAIQNDAGQRIDVAVDGLTTTISATAENLAIHITRDAQGRIVQITDPAGKSLTYAYGDYASDGTLMDGKGDSHQN